MCVTLPCSVVIALCLVKKSHEKVKKVKVSRSLLGIGAAGVRAPLYL